MEKLSNEFLNFLKLNFRLEYERLSEKVTESQIRANCIRNLFHILSLNNLFTQILSSVVYLQNAGIPTMFLSIYSKLHRKISCRISNKREYGQPND